MSELADATGFGAATKAWPRFPALRRWGLDRKQTALLAGILLLTLLAYLRSLDNGFVYDDLPAIVRNPRLRRWSFIWESMTRDVWWYYGLGAAAPKLLLSPAPERLAGPQLPSGRTSCRWMAPAEDPAPSVRGGAFVSSGSARLRQARPRRCWSRCCSACCRPMARQ